MMQSAGIFFGGGAKNGKAIYSAPEMDRCAAWRPLAGRRGEIPNGL